MKNTALFFSLCVSVACSANLLANASESESQQFSFVAKSENVLDELQKTSIDVWIYYDAFYYGSTYWGSFGWKDNGTGTVSLWPMSEGKFINPDAIGSNKYLPTTYIVTIRNENYQVTSQRKFHVRSELRLLAEYLTQKKITLGKDSIQITHTASSYHVRATGKVENFNGIDFSYPTKQQLSNYAFVPRRKGLRAFYIHQDRIDDSEYVISNQTKDLTRDATSNNAIVKYFSLYSDKPKLKVTYDSDKFAYRIAGWNHYMAWNPASDHNVFWYPKNDAADQYWMFKKLGPSGGYQIISAADVNLYLNVDQDQRNVSVANEATEAEAYNQKFSLEKR